MCVCRELNISDTEELSPHPYPKVVVDPSPLYKCVTDPHGKKFRIYIAATSCRDNVQYIYHHEAMEQHLLVVHTMICFIPGRLFLKFVV